MSKGLGATRTYDNGSFYSVSFGEDEVADFRSQWPASGLGALRNVWAQFDRRNGDLVDLQCNRRDCHRFDGAALVALTQDMQCAATKRGAKAKAPKDHCRAAGGMSGARKPARKSKRKSGCGCSG